MQLQAVVKQVKYLSFDVSVENLPVMDVFEAQTDLNKPVDDLRNMQLFYYCDIFIWIESKLPPNEEYK